MNKTAEQIREAAIEVIREKKSLCAEVYRWSLDDCTLNGASSKRDKFYCIDVDGVTDIASDGLKLYEGVEDDEIMVIVKKEFGGGHSMLRAIPLELYLSKKSPMFGGNFIYTSDSRFPSDPIKIFDRVES